MPFSPALEIRADYTTICRGVAARVAQLVRQKPEAVLGLATGSTPIGVYQELVRLYKEENLDFSGVRTFNLDEYFPIVQGAPQSYARFMREHLFDHINLAPENCRVPDGRPRDLGEIVSYCAQYEAEIENAGGLDLQILGIGRTGHIGFNEPGSPIESRTRLVLLDYLTRADAAADFFGLENVPARAITMGIGTILGAREIVLMASGKRKAAIVAEAYEGKITSKVPASFLREHPSAHFFLDREAAAELTSFAQPWRAQTADWDDFELQRRVILSLCLQQNTPISALSRADLEVGGALPLAPKLDTLKTAVETDLRARLSDDHLPENQTIFCLSPHPDDDVICCGATLMKLAARGNRIFVAYGVSGANAVRDKDVLALLRARHPRLIAYLEENLEPGKSLDDAMNEVRASIFEREPGQPDAPLMRELKRMVREGEAADGCRKMGAKPIFLALPFYSDGAHRTPVGEPDVKIILAALEQTRPDLVMLTGELNDPHGTHEMCAQAFEAAAKQYDSQFARWYYRGAWDEYEVFEGDYFSVFDKPLMEQKIGLILDHISQLDPLFPGEQPGEFWERARNRNRQNARQLQTLGVLPPSRSFDPIYAEVWQISSQKMIRRARR